MWIPKNTQEIIDAVNAGHLHESQNFDAKRELGSKNKETAKDIAAMANDGGVLIYGLMEDEYGHITGLAPIRLKGAAEKIDQIAHTSIQETPRIETFVHSLPEDPENGFLVVAVPPSDRAPHMVTVDKDNRYYMRIDRTSVPMSEGEVARLYERRRRWEVDRETLLDKLLADSTYPVYPELNYLHLFVHPVSCGVDLLPRIAANKQERSIKLRSLIEDSSIYRLYPHNVTPSFGDTARYIRPTVQGYVCESEMLEVTADQMDARTMAGYVRLDLRENGTATLFCGRAGSTFQGEKRLVSSIAVALLWRGMVCMGAFYQAVAYSGMVDIGLAITQLKGQTIHSYFRTNIPFSHDIYRRTKRVSALSLTEAAEQVARDLLMPLMDEMTICTYDPFTKP